MPSRPEQLCAFKTRLSPPYSLTLDGQQQSTKQSRLITLTFAVPYGFSHQRCRTCVTCRCVRCVHDSESVPGGTGEPANSSGSASLAALLGERGSSAIPDAASASAVPGGTSWGACTQLGKLTAPKTVGQLQQAPRIPHIPDVRGTGERGKWKRSFLFFLAHLHTSKAEPHTERGFRAGPQKKSLGRDSCHARMVGMGRD